MKIDPKMAIGSVAPTHAKPKTGLAGGFDDILKGLDKETSTKEASKVSSINFGNLNPQKMNALTTSEDALDLLDRYSQAVASPGMNLKSLEPMVNELEAMREKVNQAGSFLADNDPLKGIMNDVSSTLYGEVAKFRRGDLIG